MFDEEILLIFQDWKKKLFYIVFQKICSMIKTRFDNVVQETHYPNH